MTLTAENVGLYAETLVRQAAAGGQTLDYTRESLAVVDELLALSDPLYEVSSEAQNAIVIFYTGCYLGEVLVRTLGAQWRFAEPWSEASLVVVDARGGIEVRPFEKLQRRLSEGSEGNLLLSYWDGLAEHVTRLESPSC